MTFHITFDLFIQIKYIGQLKRYVDFDYSTFTRNIFVFPNMKYEIDLILTLRQASMIPDSVPLVDKLAEPVVATGGPLLAF